MDTDKIDKHIRFLELVLEGGKIEKAAYHNTGEKDKLKKAIDTDNKVKKEIEDLKRRKEQIIRSQKIKKIIGG